MVAPLALAGGLAALGLVKGMTVDKDKENRQRALAAETQRWSPWTGMQAQAPQEADPLAGALQGGMAGAMLGQGMANADAQNSAMTMQARQGAGWGAAAPASTGASPWASMKPGYTYG